MTRIEFSAPLANAANYPNAVIKVHPAAGLVHWQLQQHQFSEEHGIEFFRSGRSALYHAAVALKKPTQNVILLPAYHCPALVEPFLAAGYHIKFYPLAADLTVSQQTLTELLSAEITHCLLVRYFGHSGNVDQQLRWLAEQGITTFDDCAHDLQAFLAKNCDADAMITSLKKFIPSYDGGALRLKKQVPLAPRVSVPLAVEFKNGLRWLKDNLELLLNPRAVERLSIVTSNHNHHHDNEAQPFSNKVSALPMENITPNKVAAVYHAPADFAYRYLQPMDQTQHALRFTRLLFKQVNIEKTLLKRQQNCQYLMTQLQHSPLGRLLWSAQVTNVAPYVLPFVLHHAATFDWLRRCGLQIYRWEELAATECHVSQHYRLCLIQIPCHQDLTQQQLDEIVRLFS